MASYRFGVLLALLTWNFIGPLHGLSRKRVYPHMENPKVVNIDGHDVGDSLILTPLINSGRLEEARQLSRVQNLTEVVSYSGYFTVNPKYNSNMFFWYFPAVFKPQKAPVLIWLQGGPGGSSLFGLFTENGPFIIDNNMEVLMRSTSWSFTHHLLYFDNPVGTGFSFTEDDAGYARNEEMVAHDLYAAVIQFLTLFPNLASRDFFISGESYAGKYVPNLAYKIHTENHKSPQLKVNLKGIAIGDGFTDPVNMLNYGSYLYNVGLIDEKEKVHFEKEEEKARQYILSGEFSKAFWVIDDLIDGDLVGHPSYFKNCTGLSTYFNILTDKEPEGTENYATFVQLPEVRRSIHVGNRSYSDLGSKVEDCLKDDMYRSYSDMVATLLDADEKYRVLVYSGQLDIIVANILTEEFLKKMRWHGSSRWGKADKKVWRVGSDVAGNAKTVDNLTYVLVRNAGHMVPTDVPKWAFDMINRFTYKKPFA